MSGTRYLIINADDVGMFHSENVAVFEMFKEGAITSATAMAPCPWFPEAARFAAAHKQYPFGLHLTLTSEWSGYKWGPVAQSPVPSLTPEADVYFSSDAGYVEFHAEDEDVRAEFFAQDALARKLGMDISHYDNHMFSIYGSRKTTNFMEIAFELCVKHSLPFRLYTVPIRFDGTSEEQYENEKIFFSKMRLRADELSIPIIDHLLMYTFETQPDDTYESFKKELMGWLSNAQSGVNEIFLHPSVESDELKAANPHWWRRVNEFKIFMDPEFRRFIEREGFKLISYRDLKNLAR